MKPNEIRKLVRASLYYQQVVRMLSETYVSIETREPESFGKGQTTLRAVGEMLESAVREKNWLDGKIRVFEELADIGSRRCKITQKSQKAQNKEHE